MGLLGQSAAASGYDVLLQAMNIIQTVALTYIAARWGTIERRISQTQPPPPPPDESPAP
jgi:hypothetical protein